MKILSWISLLLAFAIGIALFACSSDDPVPGASSDSSDSGYSSDSDNHNDDSSDSGNQQEDSSDSSNPPDEESSSSANKPSSSSSRDDSSSSVVASSSSATAVSSSSSRAASSSSSVSTTPTCAYKSSWCEGTDFSNVATESLSKATGSHGICTFATSVSMLGNANNLSVNGTKMDRCGNSDWGQKPCTEVLASIQKADGGYYIYEQNYYADFTVTGGTPNCNGSANPGTSSSSKPSSSSAGAIGGNSSSSNNSSGGTPSYTPTAPGNQSGQTTQYWDACKPSCSWSGKGGKQANACNITGARIGHNDSDKSACDGGTAFACMDQAPWKVGNVSFGFVAVNDGACGDCYQLDFPNGEVMVVMKTNIGGINGKFDIMIPGGGVGDFDALTRQVTNSGISNPDMGIRYGGFRGQCGWEYSAQSVSCVKQKCESVFKNLPDLKAGCLWYANTLGTDNASWNNPNVKYKSVTCPKELTDKF